jgi:arylsulfatase
MTNMHYIAICLILLITLGLVGLPPFISSTRTDQSVFAQTLSVSGQQQQGQRPNILLIVGDDFGFSDIGAFGAEINTPNLDQLAKEGKIAINYHTAPTCSPARAAILTGVDWHRGGLASMYELIADNQKGKPGYETYINNKVVTVAELLRDAGYHTIDSGKWHLSGQGIQANTTPYDRGFERAFTLVGDSANHFTNGSIFPGGTTIFLENNTKVTRPGNGTLFSNDLYTDEMIKNIDAVPHDGKPLFMYLAFQVAHSPFMATPNSIKKYDQIYSAGWDKVREQRFEKQKELGIWPGNMTLPKAMPPNVPWTSLNQTDKEYAIRLLGVRASMIENMDQNVGKLINHLKHTGKYDNTLIVFTSDNGGSEAVQLPEGILALNGVDYKAIPGFVHALNNSVTNLGNSTSNVNYGAWGPYVSGAPMAGFKVSLYEGGTRVPFIIKVPTSTASANATAPAPTAPVTAKTTSPIKSFLFVTDLTPTFLDYAKVSNPGSTYKGKEIFPIMGKSLRPVLNGSAESIHGANETTGSEMFNNTAVYEGPLLAMYDASHPTGKWQLYNIVNDPAQNNNLADKQPQVLQKMIADYKNYAQKVGIVVPTGKKAQGQYSKIFPPLNQTQTIHLDEITQPFKPPVKTLVSGAVPTY